MYFCLSFSERQAIILYFLHASLIPSPPTPPPGPGEHELAVHVIISRSCQCIPPAVRAISDSDGQVCLKIIGLQPFIKLYEALRGIRNKGSVLRGRWDFKEQIMCGLVFIWNDVCFEMLSILSSMVWVLFINVHVCTDIEYFNWIRAWERVRAYLWSLQIWCHFECLFCLVCKKCFECSYTFITYACVFTNII